MSAFKCTFAMDGYFQSMIWFWEYPWVLTISLTFLLHARLQTWLPVSMLFIWCPFVVFQNLMHLSAVPPPEARRLLWWGDHVIALTAAVCSVNFRIGCCEWLFHTNNCFKTKMHQPVLWLSFKEVKSLGLICEQLRFKKNLIIVASRRKLSIIMRPFQAADLRFVSHEFADIIALDSYIVLKDVSVSAPWW